MSLSSQIPLSLALPAGAVFENFLPGPNREAFDHVGRALSGFPHRVIVLWGGAGTGKSHLLQAACHRAHETGDAAAYLPLTEIASFSPAILDGLESQRLICLDDVDKAAANRSWELALFDLYNRTEPSGTRLLLSAGPRVADMGFELADLRSRLSGALAFQLRDLSDHERHEVLQLRARERGFDIPADAVEYLLRRYPRDMHALIHLLDRLDRSTLEQQRRVTIPFIKEVMKDPVS